MSQISLIFLPFERLVSQKDTKFSNVCVLLYTFQCGYFTPHYAESLLYKAVTVRERSGNINSAHILISNLSVSVYRWIFYLSEQEKTFTQEIYRSFTQKDLQATLQFGKIYWLQKTWILMIHLKTLIDQEHCMYVDRKHKELESFKSLRVKTWPPKRAAEGSNLFLWRNYAFLSCSVRVRV